MKNKLENLTDDTFLDRWEAGTKAEKIELAKAQFEHDRQLRKDVANSLLAILFVVAVIVVLACVVVSL